MKRLVIALGLGLLMAACATDHTSINGRWIAVLSNTDGSQAFNITTSLVAITNNGLNVTSLNFNSQSSCFPGTSTATGAFVVSGSFNGMTTGGFQLTVSSTTGSNQLQLSGAVHNNTVSGTWTLTGTGSGCTGSGSFVMNKS
jgi:hypothetical protein